MQRLRGVEGDGVGAEVGYIIDVVIRIGDKSWSAVKSGISFLYRQCVIERPDYVRAGVSLYYKGPNKKWTKLVQNIGMEVTKGNNPMNL